VPRGTGFPITNDYKNLMPDSGVLMGCLSMNPFLPPQGVRVTIPSGCARWSQRQTSLRPRVSSGPA